MTIETATDATQLNPSYPEGNSPYSKADDHIRLIKYCIVATLGGATSTGVVNFNVVTQPSSTNNTLAASTAYVTSAVAAAAFTTALPSIGGNADKWITNDGITASWSDLPSYIENAAYRSFNTGWGAFNGNN